MRIKKKLTQNRRDFTAILICEHCNHKEKLSSGYDDAYYHNFVIPKMKCSKCGKTASNNYVPQQTKYSEDTVI